MELTIIKEVLFIALILLQIAVMIYLLVINYKQYKRDKSFYEKLCKDLEEQQAVFLKNTEGEAQYEPSKEIEDKK